MIFLYKGLYTFSEKKMKRITKIKVNLLILGTFLAISLIINTNLNFNARNINKSSEYSDDIIFYNDNLKLSKVSGKIHIDNNWTEAKDAGICTGNGTCSNPYVIKDLVINGGGSGSCILIENSDVYFRIENCSSYNSGSLWIDAGIKFYNVTNGILNNNTFSKNNCGISILESNNIIIFGNDVRYNKDYGIYLSYSNSNTILINTVNQNYWSGIYLSDSNNNTISENIVNNNIVIGIRLSYSNKNGLWKNIINNNRDGIYLKESNNNTILANEASNNEGYGILLYLSDNNTISENIANYNEHGIYLEMSNYNIISGNTLLGNDECITEQTCEGNIFENNDCGDKDKIITGYNLFFLLGILSVVVILINKKAKRY